jgi:hypothetical protein
MSLPFRRHNFYRLSPLPKGTIPFRINKTKKISPGLVPSEIKGEINKVEKG